MPQEPNLQIEWRHEGYRWVRVYLSDEISEDRDGLIRQLGNIANLDTVDLVRNQVDSIALERSLTATYATEPDHCDPLRQWVTIGLLPSN